AHATRAPGRRLSLMSSPSSNMQAGTAHGRSPVPLSLALLLLAVVSACPGSSTVVTDDPKRPGGPGYERPVSRYACQVQQLHVDRSRSCHGAMPSAGAPMPLRTLHALRLPSHVDGTLTQAKRSLIRMRD